MIDSSKPGSSQKVNEYTANEYWVTAASWVQVTGAMTYEIGIRHKGLHGKFWLLTSPRWDHQSVQEMAEVVCLALDHGYDPSWCQEFLT